MAVVQKRYAEPEVVGYTLQLSVDEARALWAVLSHVKLGFGPGESEVSEVLIALSGSVDETEVDYTVGFADLVEGEGYVDIEDDETIAMVFRERG